MVKHPIKTRLKNVAQPEINQFADLVHARPLCLTICFLSITEGVFHGKS
jgi:hypothetical protein